MAFHPRERPDRDRPSGRRRSSTDVPRLLGALAAAAGSARRCSPRAAATTATAAAAASEAVKLSRPDNPVTLPLFDDVPAIEDGLTIPRRARSRSSTTPEYIIPDVIAAFEEEYGVTVEVTTFTSMDEAIAKLRPAARQFDVFFPTPDVIGKVVAGKLLQPLNQSYLPTRRTSGRRCRTRSTTRARSTRSRTRCTRPASGTAIDGSTKPPDELRQPYDILWDPPYNGQVYVLDDDREVLGMAMLRGGPDRRQHRGRRAHRRRARRPRRSSTTLVNVKVGVEAYTVLPEGARQVHQAWSGDVVNAQYYLPEGESIDEHRLLVPGRRRRHDRQRHDRRARAAPSSPVLAHTVHRLPARRRRTRSRTSVARLPAAAERLDPDSVVADELRAGAPRDADHPARRTSTTGYQLLQLSPGRRAALGRRLVEVHRRCADADRAPAGGPRRLWPALAAPGRRLARPAVRRAVLRRARRRVRRPRPDLRQRRCRSGTRCEWDFTSFGDVLERRRRRRARHGLPPHVRLRRRRARRSAS